MMRVVVNQYQRDNAIHKIDGYLIPRPHESAQAAFERAKEETLAQLKAVVQHVEAIDYSVFETYRKSTRTTH